MTKDNMERYHRTYNLLYSIVLVIAGICLIAGCLCIYFSGDQSYSREIVATTFSGIAFPVYLCVAMTFINIIWGIISPIDYDKKPSVKKRAKKSDDSNSNIEETDLEEKKFRPYRAAFIAVSLVLIVLGLVNGGTIAVLAKAINICTECIGLG